MSATRIVKAEAPSPAGVRATLAFRSTMCAQRVLGRCAAVLDDGRVCAQPTSWAFELEVPRGSIAASLQPRSKFALAVCRKHGRMAERAHRLRCWVGDWTLVDGATARRVLEAAP